MLESEFRVLDLSPVPAQPHTPPQHEAPQACVARPLRGHPHTEPPPLTLPWLWRGTVRQRPLYLTPGLLASDLGYRPLPVAPGGAVLLGPEHPLQGNQRTAPVRATTPTPGGGRGLVESPSPSPEEGLFSSHGEGLASHKPLLWAAKSSRRGLMS